MADTDYSQYGVLAGNVIDASSGTTKIVGDLGSYNDVSGSGTVTVTGQYNTGSSIDSALSNAQAIYGIVMSFTPGSTVSTQNIGGMTFYPGITQFTYSSGSVIIGGSSPNNQITLDGYGTYFFLIPSANLTTTTTTLPIVFNLLNGAIASQVYWFVNGDVILQTQSGNITPFVGSVFARGDITLGTGCTSSGGLISPFDDTGTITVNGNTIVSLAHQAILDQTSNDYINIESTLADSEAIQIKASNSNGGILINAGFGGIKAQTTNSINLNATNASQFRVSGSGNLLLQADNGLVNIDGASGINIGNGSTDTVNIGTSASSENITIGNNTGTTSVNIDTGSGNFNVNTGSSGNTNISSQAISMFASGASSNLSLATTGDNQDLTIALSGNNNSSIILSSQGNGSDSISLITGNGGGLSGSIDGGINLVSGATGTIVGSSGGVSISSGASGIVMNTSSGGAIALGPWAGGEILVGTGSFSRPILIGNNASSTTVIERFGSSGTLVQSQFDPTDLSSQSANTSVTSAQLLTRIVLINPTAGINLSLPTSDALVAAINALSGFNGIQNNDAIDFTVINQSSSFTVTVTSTTTVGNMAVASQSSGLFRVRITSKDSPTAFSVYRVA
jgi:hypothetical protein